MSEATDLRIPGPTPLPPAVKQAMQRDMIPHRGSAFRALFPALLDQLRRIHGTDGDALVFAATGSAGWESSLVNSVSTGDNVIALVNGSFGARFADVARMLRLDVTQVDVEWGQAVTKDVVSAALDAHPNARAVLLVHNETSTGVLNPLQDIGPLVRSHGALLLVDAVSSVGAVPMEMDQWCVDIVFSGSQKAWMCPPGLLIVALGSRVWPAYERSSYPRFYWDFHAAVEQAREGNTRTTAPLTMLYALKAACDMIDAESTTAVYARHERIAARVRSGLAELGFSLFADPNHYSPTVTAAAPPAGWSATQFVQALREESGIELAVGQAHLRDQLVRFGHLGWVHEPEIERTLNAMSSVLSRTSV